MRRILSILTAAAVALTLAVPVEAQFARAGVEGVIRSPDGAPLPGATVTVVNEASGFKRSTVTSATGGYRLAGLTPGAYVITFTLAGFRTVVRTGIQLAVGTSPRLNVAMELGGVEETITVAAPEPLVETTSKQVGGTLGTQEFRDLPSQNRSAVLFAALLPGVVPSPASQASAAADSVFVNGQDEADNSFNVDGVNNDDDVIGGIAGAQTRIAFEAIQEFQVLTSQFDAEFGRATGGVINAVTKSGGNTFHGNMFAYLQDSSFNSMDFFVRRLGRERPDEAFRSLGGTVGGPIVENVAHFFASVEINKADEGVSREFSTRPDLDFVTTVDNRIRNWLLRGDWQATTDNKVMVRYLRERSFQFNQIIGSTVTRNAAREEEDTDQNLVGAVDSVLTDRAFNSFRLSFTRENVSFANNCFITGGKNFAAQRSCAVAEARPGIMDGNSTTAVNRINNSIQADDTLSWYLPGRGGDHHLRVGLQYAFRTEKVNRSDNANGTFSFDTTSAFDPNDITTYPLFFSARVGGDTSQIEIPRNQTMGLFAQDDWQPLPDLTLHLGLRWDWEGITEDNDNWAPRVGVSWDPVGDGRTVVRGGAGRFYNRLRMAAFDDFFFDALTSPSFTSRLPTSGSDQQLFFDLAQQRGITTLNDLRDAVVAVLDAQASSLPINRFPHVDNDERRQEYTDSLSVGVEREIVNGVSVAADYVRIENKNQLAVVDLNPFSMSQGGRPDISIIDGEAVQNMGSIHTFMNRPNSSMTYNSTQLHVRRRFADSPLGRIGGRISYTWATEEGNALGVGEIGGRGGSEFTNAYFQTRTETGFNFDTGEIIGEEPDLNLDEPRILNGKPSFLRRHNFVVSWTYEIPGTSWTGSGGIIVSGIWRWMSGDRSFFVVDDRLDNFNRDIGAAGTYNANVVSDIARNGTQFDGTLGGAENPGYNKLDLSFRYRIPFGRAYNLTILADCFNAANSVNFNGIGSTRITLDNFLIPSGAFPARNFQVGARLDF